MCLFDHIRQKGVRLMVIVEDWQRGCEDWKNHEPTAYFVHSFDKVDKCSQDDFITDANKNSSTIRPVSQVHNVPTEQTMRPSTKAIKI